MYIDIPRTKRRIAVCRCDELCFISIVFYCQLALSPFVFFSFLFVSCMTHTTWGRVCCIVLALSRFGRIRVVCFIMPALSRIDSHRRRRHDPKPFSRKVSAHGRLLYSFNSICVHLSSFSCRVLIPPRISIFSFKTELNVGQRRVKDKKREVLKYMSEEGFRITGSLRRSGPALAHTFSFSHKVQALTFLLNILRHKS